MSTIYETGEYLAATGHTWHSEDSPWKAQQILAMIRAHDLQPQSVGEVGCGAGSILVELQRYLKDCRFEGYDISPDAIRLSQATENCSFYCRDIFTADKHYDLLLAIDVFEHVPDYLGFLEKCSALAQYKIYHIPLDVNVLAVLRNMPIHRRKAVGHLHYFDAETALATLSDTGHQIVDYRYTSHALGLFRVHPSIRKAIANGPRWLLSRLSTPLAARLFGGYSLLVLAK